MTTTGLNHPLIDLAPVRKMGQGTEVTYGTYKPFITSRPADTVANIVICLIHQANYLLDQQIRQLEQAFLKEGGLRERMTRARLAQRDKQRGFAR